MHVVQALQAQLPTAKGGCGSAWVAIASTLNQIEMNQFVHVSILFSFNPLSL
jgi:hypothetical protein